MYPGTPRSRRSGRQQSRCHRCRTPAPGDPRSASLQPARSAVTRAAMWHHPVPQPPLPHRRAAVATAPGPPATMSSAPQQPAGHRERRQPDPRGSARPDHRPAGAHSVTKAQQTNCDQPRPRQERTEADCARRPAARRLSRRRDRPPSPGREGSRRSPSTQQRVAGTDDRAADGALPAPEGRPRGAAAPIPRQGDPAATEWPSVCRSKSSDSTSSVSCHPAFPSGHGNTPFTRWAPFSLRPAGMQCSRPAS